MDQLACILYPSVRVSCSSSSGRPPPTCKSAKECMYQQWLILLPPTNEVWGKVIFSEASVGHFIHGGGGGLSLAGGAVPRVRSH